MIQEEKIEDPCKVCGTESNYGCHGLDENGKVKSDYYCTDCYNKVKKGKIPG